MLDAANSEPLSKHEQIWIGSRLYLPYGDRTGFFRSCTLDNFVLFTV